MRGRETERGTVSWFTRCSGRLWPADSGAFMAVGKARRSPKFRQTSFFFRESHFSIFFSLHMPCLLSSTSHCVAPLQSGEYALCVCTLLPCLCLWLEWDDVHASGATFTQNILGSFLERQIHLCSRIALL